MNLFPSGFVSKDSPIAWWLLVGENITGKVLLIGDFDETSLRFISQISAAAYSEIENKYTHKPCENNNVLFDAIIINSQFDIYPLNLLEKTYSRLSENGVIALIEVNQKNITENKFKPFQLLSDCFYDRKNMISKSCYKSFITQIPSMSDDVNLYESFAPKFYQSNKNNFLLKEKIKKYILNSKINSLFFSKNIWLINNRDAAANLISETRNKLCELSGNTTEFNMDWSTIYYKYGKLIFSFVDKNTIKYAVIAFSQYAVEQRDNELIITAELLKHETLKKYFNGPIEKHVVCGLNCYIMNENKGLVVDIDNKNIDKMMFNAYSALMDLTLSTYSSQANITTLADHITFYFERLLGRAKPYRDKLELIRHYLQKELINSELPSVCVHGDLKLENFVLNNQYFVSGIIDWELGELEGFPLIDVLYLIIYNREVSHSENFSQAYISVLNGNLGTHESRMLDDYCLKLSLTQQQRRLLTIVFFIHHYSVRYHIKMNNEEDNVSLKRCIDSIFAFLQKNGAIF